MNNKVSSRILLLLDCLWKTSDEQHPVSISSIINHLKAYGLSVKDARTIRADIADLVEFGFDVVVTRSVQNQYFIGTRHFEAPEIKLLIDAVQSSRFITPKKSKALIEKLSVFVGPNQTDTLNRCLYVDQRAKSDNENIYITVDAIQTAISQKRMIEFLYFEYLPTKEKHFKHEGKAYELSPYATLWSNDSYYVIGFSTERRKIVKFRIDRIEQLGIMDEAQVPPPDDFNVSEFFTQEFSMLDGTVCEVELLCENALMNSIIDRFGESVDTQIVDDAHFVAKAKVDLSGTFYGWVFASAGRMKIIGPQEALDGFKNTLNGYI